MKHTLETQFGLGDAVDVIYRKPVYGREPCDTCGGGGGLYSASGERLRDCYSCRGGCVNTNVRIGWTWYVAHHSIHIEQVRIVIGHGPSVEYMCRETGLGSGSVYTENGNLVPAGAGDRIVEERNASAEGTKL